MPLPPSEVEAARTSFAFWTANGLTPAQACGMLAMMQGESDFRTAVVGDHGEAFGPFQLHWNPRGAAIFEGCGIDVRDPATTLEQHLLAVHWELTKGAEKRAWAKLTGAQTVAEAAAAGVTYYERPLNKPAAIARRTQYAIDWARTFGVPL